MVPVVTEVTLADSPSSSATNFETRASPDVLAAKLMLDDLTQVATMLAALREEER